MFAPIREKVDYYRTIHAFILYVDQLLVLSLQLENDHILIQDAALTFFEVVCNLNSKYGMPFAVSPSFAVVYRMLLSSSAMSVSRVCGILSAYKVEFDQLKKSLQSPEQSRVLISNFNLLQDVKLLNGYIWEFCTALWNNKLFLPNSNREINQYFILDEKVLQNIRYPTLHFALSLTHCTPLISMGNQYLKELERSISLNQEAIVLKPEMITGTVRYHFLEYLLSRGCIGLYEFLYAYIRPIQRVK